MQQSAGDRQLLLHAAREFGGERILLGGELELLEEDRNARRRVGDAIQARHEL